MSLIHHTLLPTTAAVCTTATGTVGPHAKRKAKVVKMMIGGRACLVDAKLEGTLAERLLVRQPVEHGRCAGKQK